MKIRWNEEYKTKAVYIFLICLAVIIALMIFLNLSGVFDAIGFVLGVLTPFIWGFAIAYVLNRPLNFFETRVFAFVNRKKPRPSLARGLSVLVCVLLLLAVVAGLMMIIIPSLIESLNALIDALPGYMTSFNETIRNLGDSLRIKPEAIETLTLSWDKLIGIVNSYLVSIDTTIADFSINLTVSVISGLVTALIALISSIYMMGSKEKFIGQSKKFMYALMKQERADHLLKEFRMTHRIFSGFINGKLIESLFVGILTFIAMTIFSMPYALLISVIMGIFNIIPYFGPFIGAIPSALLLLMVDPLDALWFVIITLVLQQIDGQLIGPKILGGSTGITAFWVIFAIMIGGGFCGLLGMILGIPVFAVIYNLVGEFINGRLKKKGLSTRADDYVIKRPQEKKNKK